MPQDADTIAIVTVHGTGDTAEGADGQKWFQKGSAFTEQVKNQLAARGIESEIIPHLWSGANSAWERERAADKLADRLRRLFKTHKGVHVIAHSHGGNVANDAAVLLKWGLRRGVKNEYLDSLTTVGTPFFDIRTGWLQVVAGLLFLVITWGSVLALGVMAVFALWAYLIEPLLHAGRIGGEVRLNWEAVEPVLAPTHVELPVSVMIALVVLAVCLVFMFRLSRQGVRRILRPRAGGRTTTSVFSIWHENDEAIAFLQRVEELKLEPFPRGALFRGSRGLGITIGVLGVILIGVVAPVLYFTGIADVFDFNNNGADADILGNNITVAFMALVFAPFIFVATYFTYRYLIGGAQEILARGTMNRFVGGVLRGVAMGRDGDQILCSVGPRSHTHRSEEHVLSGDCASRMQERANGAAGALIDKYRWSLFSVGGESSASLTSLTTDAMTWDSLIHTTYFDQPEVAQVIGDYIARKAQEAAAETIGQRAPAAPIGAAPQTA
jgi:hypothetical protein